MPRDAIEPGRRGGPDKQKGPDRQQSCSSPVATIAIMAMVTEFGMSEKLGSVRYAGQRLQYMGTAVEDGSDNSVESRALIDDEVRRIIREQSARAEALLGAHRDALTRLSADLLKAESLDGSAVRQALAAA